jgi:putative transposase
LNAYAERFVRSIKTECLDRLIIFGEAALRRAVGQYTDHYHTERNHQGLGNAIPFPDEQAQRRGVITKSERWGGLLCDYHREAA